jgi:acyl-CoA synthetase (NDP forming)
LREVRLEVNSYRKERNVARQKFLSVCANTNARDDEADLPRIGRSFTYTRGHNWMTRNTVICICRQYADARCAKRLIAELKSFFDPDSVAIVGASHAQDKVGHRITRNLLKLGFSGKIFPVNPNTAEILGLKTYAKILEIPDKVDTAIICTPATQVVDIVEDCARKGVSAAIVVSSGFSEEGEEGKRLEETIVSRARSTGMRIIGPNTTGVLNTATGFTSSWFRDVPILKGRVAFIAQTGVFAGVICEYILASKLFGLSKVVGLGNKCDVNEVDVLEYLLEDPLTGTVMMYLEGITQGRRFFDLAKRATRKKPVVVVKSGITEEGKRMALSHTGSMTGDDRVFEAVCTQTGIIRVANFEELMDLAQALALMPLPKGKRVAIIDISGASCVVASDVMMRLSDGLEYGELSSGSLARLREVTPPWHRISNPIDLTASILSAGADAAYEAAFEVLTEDPHIDAGIVSIAALEGMIPDLRLFRRTAEKPILFSVLGNNLAMVRVTEELRRIGYPVFPFPHRAVKVLHWMYQASKTINTREGTRESGGAQDAIL